MVISAMSTTRRTLEAKGIPVCHAYPGSRTYEINRAVAAIEVESIDQKAGTSTVCVHVLAPAALGAEVCENTAADICIALHNAGAVCFLHQCGFLREANLFQILISAVFNGIT